MGGRVSSIGAARVCVWRLEVFQREKLKPGGSSRSAQSLRSDNNMQESGAMLRHMEASLEVCVPLDTVRRVRPVRKFQERGKVVISQKPDRSSFCAVGSAWVSVCAGGRREELHCGWCRGSGQRVQNWGFPITTYPTAPPDDRILNGEKWMSKDWGSCEGRLLWEIL